MNSDVSEVSGTVQHSGSLASLAYFQQFTDWS